MVKLKKITIRVLLVMAILAPVAALAHYIVFPQETRSILIRYSDFKKDGSLYFSPATPAQKIDSLQVLIQQASARVVNFWGAKRSNPDYIYCEREADFKKYGSNAAVPACTFLKLGSHIVLSKDGADPDIIAHEISHAELYERIGFYKWNFGIPAWFKHGLAMQNDDRAYYSEGTLRAQTNNLKDMPDIKSLKKDSQFYAGSIKTVMLNYSAAKYEVKNWYTKEKLLQLVSDLNAGKSFDEAYH